MREAYGSMSHFRTISPPLDRSAHWLSIRQRTASPHVPALRAQGDDEAAVPPPLRDALEKYRVAVTNKKATREGECASSRRALEAALQEHRLLETVKARATPAAGEATGQAQDKGDARSARTGRLGMGDYYTRMQRVVPGLYIGSYHPATDLEQLDGEGITHICCCIATPARFPGKHKVSLWLGMNRVGAALACDSQMISACLIPPVVCSLTPVPHAERG